MNKLEIAKKLLKEKNESLKQSQEFIDEAPNKYIGKALDNEVRRWTEDCEELGVETDALGEYIYNIEMQIKQGEEHDADEAKAEELLNQLNSENIHND